MRVPAGPSSPRSPGAPLQGRDGASPGSVSDFDHNCTAAGCAPAWYLNPIEVLVSNGNQAEGHLLIGGDMVSEVALSAADTLDPGSVSPKLLESARDAVSTALQETMSRCELMVAEGAGSATEIAATLDIANAYVVRHVAAHVVLTASHPRGGAAAGVIGLHTMLPPDLRRAVVGYVLTNSSHARAASWTAQEIRRHTGLTFLGTIPHVPSDGSDAYGEDFFDRAADAVARLEVSVIGSRRTV